MERFAPLINLLYSDLAFGELIVRFLVGDHKGAAEAYIAQLASFLSGYVPYRFEKGNGINKLSSLMNTVYSLVISSYIIASSEPPQSLTYAIFPMFAAIQAWTNLLEAYKNRKIE
jgi:hypothetical protein